MYRTCSIRMCFDIMLISYNNLYYVVHGFADTIYDVVEGNILQTLFQLNVKGETLSDRLNISGTITAVATGTASKS